MLSPVGNKSLIVRVVRGGGGRKGGFKGCYSIPSFL